MNTSHQFSYVVNQKSKRVCDFIYIDPSLDLIWLRTRRRSTSHKCRPHNRRGVLIFQKMRPYWKERGSHRGIKNGPCCIFAENARCAFNTDPHALLPSKMIPLPRSQNATPQRREAFMALQTKEPRLIPIRDVQTRWNSTFMMLNRAKRLQPFYDQL